MAKLILVPTDENLVIPVETLRELGFAPGAPVEVSSRPSAALIQGRALRHAARYLGDAIGVGTPQWVNDEWQVELFAPEGQQPIGRLVLTPRGEVVSAKSMTREQLKRSSHAASAGAPPNCVERV